MENPQIRGLNNWRMLGRGATTEVWEARQLSLDRRVAVKIYEDEQDQRDSGFLREVAAAGRLSGHPGILTVYDAGVLLDDRLYLLTEFCPGGAATRWLDPSDRLTTERIRQLGVKLADALAATHAAGIVHRGVMPSAILIDGFGNPRLADFGRSVMTGTEMTGPEVSATSAYAPPESSDGRPIAASGDVFSLAASLYALLTSQALGASGGSTSTADGPLAGVLVSAMDPDPARRPTAAALRDQLVKVSSVDASASTATTEATSALPIEGAAAPGPIGRAASITAGRGWGRGRAGVPALAAALVAVIGSALIWLATESATNSALPEVRIASSDSSVVVDAATPTPIPTDPGGDQSHVSPTPASRTIELQDSALTITSREVAEIHGTYSGGAHAFVHAEHQEGVRWIAFPLPAMTDQSGRFTLYLGLDQPGRHLIRVVDPGSGLKSDTIVVVVRR